MKSPGALPWILVAALLLAACPRSGEHAGHEAVPAPSAEEIAHWTCSMHPSVRQTGPGKCPICSMDLHPVLKRELESGELSVPRERRAELGIALTAAAPHAFGKRIRAQGRVVYDESSLADVTARVGGYVEELYVKTTGERVQAGAPLVSLFSPDLVAAQEELLAAISSQNAARSTAAPERADYLVAAARKRLKVWGMTEEAIEAVQRTGKPMERFVISAPTSGVVLERMVVEGGAVEPGMKLFRLVGMDRVWIEAEIYEADLSQVRVGQRAEIELPSLSGRRIVSRVSLYYPALDATTRTARVRLEMPSGSYDLRPEMFAQVELALDLGTRLAVPVEAVLHTGQRRIVFVEIEGGRLVPRAIEVGLEGDGFVEVLAGLVAGEQVVSQGTFLVAAESRLKQSPELRP